MTRLKSLSEHGAKGCCSIIPRALVVTKCTNVATSKMQEDCVLSDSIQVVIKNNILFQRGSTLWFHVRNHTRELDHGDDTINTAIDVSDSQKPNNEC
jgi:hypothetical protein